MSDNSNGIRIIRASQLSGMPIMNNGVTIYINGISITISEEQYESLVNQAEIKNKEDYHAAVERYKKYMSYVEKCQQLTKDVRATFYSPLGDEEEGDLFFRKDVTQDEIDLLLEKHEDTLGF